MIISIIGGTSGFGLWLGKYIKNNFKEHEVIVTGRNKEKGEKAVFGTLLIFSSDNEDVVKKSDIVIFSIPISNMEKTIKELAPKVKKGAILADICSIKGFPYDTMKKYAPKSCFIIPTHPMFGPYIEKIAGQIFVLTVEKEYRNDERYIYLKNFLNKKGAKIIETTAENHDKMMAVVQGLTHINMFTIGETIKRLNIPVEETLNFVSPIYKLMISSVARYIGHDAKLYGDIQMYNKEVLNVHDKFMEVIQDFNKTVQEKNEEEFISIIDGTKFFFGKDTTTFGQKYTDKIIYLLTNQIDLINKNIGKELNFKNIYNGTEKKGIIKELKNNILIFYDGEKIDINEYVIM